jgi:hypothetical protein
MHNLKESSKPCPKKQSPLKKKRALKVIDEFNIEEIDFTPPTWKTNKFRGKRTVIHPSEHFGGA